MARSISLRFSMKRKHQNALWKPKNALSNESEPDTGESANSMPGSTSSALSDISITMVGSMGEDTLPDELQLLDDEYLKSHGRSEDHEFRTAPLMTRDAYVTKGLNEYVKQYGVMGRAVSIHHQGHVDTPEDPRLYVNTNAPFSAIVCGVQGAGKSHTVSVMLENMFIPNCKQIGSLEKPLCGLVLHFGEGGPGSHPSEAAYLGRSQHQNISVPPVCVYVSKSSLNTMKSVYAPLGNNIIVEPLLFNKSELDAEAFMSMMAVGSSDSAPLYVQIILSILRDLGESFTYDAFILELNVRKKTFNPAQVAGLEQRLSLLTAFTNPKKGKIVKDFPRFRPGQLTIIDLSDPFIDSNSACGLFEIVIRLFLRAQVGTGKVLVVDEAHKYLSANNGSSGLTKALLTLTREQRHHAMRVIISTQEPTVVPPVLLDLCTISILHRFSSPSWWEHLSHHVSADFSGSDAFDQVVKLQAGEAIVLAPSGLGLFRHNGKEKNQPKQVGAFGRRYLLMKTRKRITADGGGSVLVL